METPTADRQAQLRAMKLRAIVTEHLGSLDQATVVPAASFGLGAALVVASAGRGAEAWVLLAERPERGLGPALAWARQAGLPDSVSAVHVLAEDARAAGRLARRAELFDVAVRVWQVDGRMVIPAVPAEVEPTEPIDGRHEQLRALIVAGGAIPVEERGVLVGEVHGLEVCRVTDGPDGTARLEVGVGAHDREAFGLVHGDVPTVDALAGVVNAVAAHRAPGAEPHPLNRLGAERALRSNLIADPALVGARSLRPGQPPVVRTNVKDPAPCVAVGESADGRSLIVVCSVGVDLDVVPYAADAWLAAGDDPRLVVALPTRDLLPVTQALAAWARPAIELVPV